MRRLLENLYGRRIAGKTWRDKFKLVLRQVPEARCKRRASDRGVFVDQHTGGSIMHCIDDVRGTGPAEFCQKVVEYLTTQLWVLWDPLGTDGSVGKFFKRTQSRLGARVLAEPCGERVCRFLCVLDLTT